MSDVAFRAPKDSDCTCGPSALRATSRADCPLHGDMSLPAPIPPQARPDSGAAVTDWILRGNHINEFQQASIARVVKRCKQAHFTNLDIRINGKNEAEEADWVKWLEPVNGTAGPQREAAPTWPCKNRDAGLPQCDLHCAELTRRRGKHCSDNKGTNAEREARADERIGGERNGRKESVPPAAPQPASQTHWNGDNGCECPACRAAPQTPA